MSARFTLAIGLSGRMNFQPANYTQGRIEACLYSIDFLLLRGAWIDHVQQILGKGNRKRDADRQIAFN